MKKLFLAFMVLSAFVLASCGSKDMSYKNGDVSFSISGSEVGRYLAARDVNGSQNNTIEFAILAQIKGSKGYQAWQMGKAYYTPGTDSVVVETDAEPGDLPEQIQNHVESLRFPFKHIPANQTYTVMVDVFKKEDKPDPFPGAWRVSLSGEKSAVKVRAGSSTPVTLELYGTDMQPNNFALKVSYSKNNKTQSELVSLDEGFFGKYKFAKDDNNIWFSHAGREWHSLTGFKLVLDSSSHFSKGADFSLVQNDPTAATEGDLKFGKKVVAQASKGEIDLLPMCLVKEEGSDNGLYKTIELDFEGIVLYQNLDLDIGVEKENFGYFSSYENNYKFVKDTQASDDSKVRFVMTIPLEDIFGEDPLEKGDSIAFVLSGLSIVTGENRIVARHTYEYKEEYPYPKLAYKLQKNSAESDPTKRYENNTTIYAQQFDDSLVLASNFIDGDEKYLQIYIDLKPEVDNIVFNSINELAASFSISYKVFPASDKVYIFHTNFDPYGDPVQYRVDMDIKLNSYLKASGRKPKQASTVTVPVGGTFYWVSTNSKAISGQDNIYGNFIDNAGYVEDGSTTESWYHILSGEISNGIKPDGSIDAFAFDKITKPHEKQDGDEYFVDNDFGLQCYYRLGEDVYTSNLLVIENFSIGASVDG